MNGTFLNYKIFVTTSTSTTENDWGPPVAEGSFDWALVEIKDVVFAPKAGQYVIFQCTSGMGGWTAAGEVWVYERPIDPYDLVLPANGGRLESFTSQFDTNAWAAARLTDGFKDGVGRSWASTPLPTGSHDFTYSFLNQEVARLESAVIYNSTEPNQAYWSKEVEFSGSMDGTSWSLISTGLLAQGFGPQAFDLNGSIARYVKVAVKSGYSSTYRELGEIECMEGLRPTWCCRQRREAGVLHVQFDTNAWAAARLTDGVAQGDGTVGRARLIRLGRKNSFTAF